MVIGLRVIIHFMILNAVVSAEDIIKDYGGLRAVAGVSLDVMKAECFGFLGPNGAGKTTMMRMAHCFMPPTSGNLRVFGLDVGQNTAQIKSRMGVMPQDDNLDPDLNAMENLVVYARYFDIPASVSKPKAVELLKFMELEDKSNVNVRKLSGGMKRRLLLARALMNDPELLILDEPTTGMDPHSRMNVWQSMRHLLDKGMTIMMSTHYMEEAERMCSRVAIMDTGRIVAIDAPDALISSHGCRNLEEVYLKLTGRRLNEY